MAWQLWHLTQRFSACHPRLSSVIPRRAATRSCSTTLPVSESSFAGDVVPQKEHTSACLAGFHVASAPQAGQENFCCAIVSAIGWSPRQALANEIADDS